MGKPPLDLSGKERCLRSRLCTDGIELVKSHDEEKPFYRTKEQRKIGNNWFTFIFHSTRVHQPVISKKKVYTAN